jgi:putative membrane protein
MRKIRLTAVPFAVLLLAAACSSGTMGTMTPGMPGGMAESDIAGIVTAVHEGEVAQGNAAASRASSAEVRSFAQMMVNDHTNALNNARSTFGTLSLTAGENETSRSLRSGSDRTISALNTYSGAAFDRPYMQAQVNNHQWVLTSLDTVLIPSARSPELRSLLQAQRASVVTHLEHARRVLAGLP